MRSTEAELGLTVGASQEPMTEHKMSNFVSFNNPFDHNNEDVHLVWSPLNINLIIKTRNNSKKFTKSECGKNYFFQAVFSMVKPGFSTIWQNLPALVTVDWVTPAHQLELTCASQNWTIVLESLPVCKHVLYRLFYGLYLKYIFHVHQVASG